MHNMMMTKIPLFFFLIQQNYKKDISIYYWSIILSIQTTGKYFIINLFTLDYQLSKSHTLAGILGHIANVIGSLEINSFISKAIKIDKYMFQLLLSPLKVQIPTFQTFPVSIYCDLALVFGVIYERIYSLAQMDHRLTDFS